MESCTNCSTEMTAEHVCPNCGLDSEQRDFVLEPPRSHELDEPNREASRVRADRSTPSNLALHDFGLGSQFDGSLVEGDIEKCELFARMETLNEDESSEDDRSLRAAMCSIDALGELLGLPDSVERRVAYLYRKARKKGLTQRRDLRAVLGALITIATRENGTPRARAEILSAVNELSSMHPQLGKDYDRKGRNVNKAELENAEREIRKSLDLDVPAPKPEQYVPQFATKLGLGREGMALAAHICRFVDTNELSCDPKLAAAAVLYEVAREETTRENVLEKLPIGYAPQLSTMAGKIPVLIHDQVYNPNAEVESSAEPGTFEHFYDELAEKLDHEKIKEARDILYKLLEKWGVPIDELFPKNVSEFISDGLPSEKSRKESRNRMYA